MILVDTSVWVEFVRRKNPLDLESIVAIEEIATCPPIVQEVLQGFREERSFRIAHDSMLALPIVEDPMGTRLFIEGAQLYRAARRRGLTVRSATDCLIAACALRHDLEVLHRDRDYPALAEISPLRQRQP